MRHPAFVVGLFAVFAAACSAPTRTAPNTPSTSIDSTEDIRLDSMNVDPTQTGEQPDQVPPIGKDADSAAVVKQAQRRVRADFAKIRGCYDEAYLTNRNLAGTVVLRFTLIPSGQISQPKDAGSTIGDQAVVTCVSNALIRTKFDAFDGPGMRLYVPLKFTPPLSRTAENF